MSVGHVARVFEERGIATVAVFIAAFAHYAGQMRLPRVVVTPHPMGRPLGPPGDAATQRAVLEAALQLVDRATDPGAVVEAGGPYRPGAGS